MSPSRLERGQSDPVSFTCTCSALILGGTVLLFYRYWDNHPQLPKKEREKTTDLENFAGWHRLLAEKYKLTGKIRIAREGYNVTVAGTKHEIASYITECQKHWSFAGLPLNSEEEQHLFFKPSDGCACVFGAEPIASVRITAEITPMGIEGYAPLEWDNIEVLLPAEFHKRCHEEQTLLLDVRNNYETRIGYFVSPQTGEPALRPPIRRFSQWPQYIQRHLLGSNGNEQKQILTYCTGGIRCEKATRWMQEKLVAQPGQKICTLQGGIATYLAWMDEEIKQGSMQPEDSLFRGRNYVFDARGSTGLSAGSSLEPVSRCHVCAVPADCLSKCQSRGCHLILVTCPNCSKKDLRCCQDCHNIDNDLSLVAGEKQRPMCFCEKQRELQLWGGERVKLLKTQGWRKAKKKAAGSIEDAISKQK